MTPILSNAGNTAMLCRIPTDRFKTGLLSFLAAIPIDRESACLAPLLLSVLRVHAAGGFGNIQPLPISAGGWTGCGEPAFPSVPPTGAIC